jgi:hypothetical protein
MRGESRGVGTVVTDRLRVLATVNVELVLYA